MHERGVERVKVSTSKEGQYVIGRGGGSSAGVIPLGDITQRNETTDNR